MTGAAPRPAADRTAESDGPALASGRPASIATEAAEIPWYRDWLWLATLAIVLLLALAARLYRLDALPPGLAYDEAWEGIDGARILAGARPIFLPENNGREPLFAYTVATTIALLGQSATAVRAAGVVWGLASVVAMAVLGGALVGRRLALGAAAITAATYWPLHLSRVGLRPIAMVPFEAVAAAGLVVAFGLAGRLPARRRRLPLAVATGLALGLGLYTYLPARLMLAVAALAVAIALLRDLGRRDRVGAKATLQTALIILVVMAATAAPLARHFVRHPADWTGRGDQVTVLNAIRTGADPAAVLTENLGLTLGGFVWRGDQQARHNLPGRPVFDPIGVGVLVVGLLAAPRRLGWRATLIVLGWLLVMLVPAWLSDSAPHFLRAVGAMPPALLLAAVGLVAVHDAAVVLLGRGRLTRHWLGRHDPTPPSLVDRPGPAPQAPIERVDTLVPSRLDRSDTPAVSPLDNPGPTPSGTLARPGVRPPDPIVQPGPTPRRRRQWPGPSARPRDDSPPRRLLAAAVPVALVVAMGGLTARDYFVRFAAPAVSAESFQADVATIAARIAARPDRAALVGPIEPDHPALRFLAPGRAIETFPPDSVALLPAGDRPLDVYPRADAPGAIELARAAYPGATSSRDGGIVRIEVPPGQVPAPPRPARPLGVGFGPIELIGVDLASAPGGGELPLRLYWRATGRPVARFAAFVHLVDAEGRGWAQEDLEPGAGGLPTDRWRPGEIVVDQRRIPLAPGIPPGEYLVRIGLAELGTDRRLPVTNAAALGPAAGPDVAIVSGARIEPGGRLNLWRLPLTEHLERDIAAGDVQVRLIGDRLEPAVQAGESLAAILVWEKTGRSAADATISLAARRGDQVLARTSAPIGGRLPLGTWRPADVRQDVVMLALPAETGGGPAELWLTVEGTDLAPIRLGSFTVETRRRSFVAPAPAYPVGARFGQFAELVGYDLDSTEARPGESVRLRLIWRATGTASRDNTIFLHLVDADDRVRGQVDSPPAAGAAPTRTWLVGEAIVDERTVLVAPDAPPGAYRFAVGFYDPRTGQRVPLTAGGAGDRLVFGRLDVERR